MINLQSDTKVYVKASKNATWKLRHFVQWGDNEDILTHGSTITSENWVPGQWISSPYWRVAEGKYKGINNEEKSLTEGRSNLALFCFVFGSSTIVVDAIAKYLSYISKYDFLLNILGAGSLTIFILIMIFGKK